jgi:5'-3' exonuclease
LGEEADDRLGIGMSTWEPVFNPYTMENSPEPVICSIDKDLHQITGTHYNFVKDEWTRVFPEEGEHFFWKQVLTGDVVDNIKGIYGIGPKRAEKILSGCSNTDDYFARVFDEYRRAYKEQAERELLVTGRVIKIRTREGELWNFPTEYLPLQPSLDKQLSSTPLELEENVQSTEPTTTG